MAVIVQKYGGSSLADADAIRNVAGRIVRTKLQGGQVVAVVSAMGDTTDELIGLAHQLSDRPEPREMDLLLSTGELVQIDARPPRPGTLEWYRLACSLPQTLPPEAQLSTDPRLRQQASADYATVMEDLGACERQREF